MGVQALLSAEAGFTVVMTSGTAKARRRKTKGLLRPAVFASRLA